MLSRNAEIIFMVCSHLSAEGDCKPYTPAEWSRLANVLMQANLQPQDLPVLSDTDFRELQIGREETKRIRQLLKRGGNLAFALEKLESIGIFVVTRADAMYPKMLKNKLGKSCPPLFYYAGNLKLADKKSIGFVGARGADENDIRFTERIISKTSALGYSVVSGGAKGVDRIADAAALRNGKSSVIYLADSMVRRIKNHDTIEAIHNGKLLLLTAVHPNMGFSVGTAMMRNRYIYANSIGTVVVRSDYKKGGTWNGAEDCLKHNIGPIFCWDNPSYKGNQELIRLGAIPIDEDWNGDPTFTPPERQRFTQMTLFD